MLTLPLFPLGTVLFPGMLLPLNIFEERYRQLVRDLRAGPGPQRFGVIAIRKGRETGADGVSALYGTGCVAAVRRAYQILQRNYKNLHLRIWPAASRLYPYPIPDLIEW